jgi:hypothetical protein
MSIRIKFHAGNIVSSVDDAGPWFVEARDPARLRVALGDDLLIPFAQLFVWTDRLAAIAHVLYLHRLHVQTKPLTTDRDAVAMIAYGIGVLYEASRAIWGLRRAGIAGLIPYSTNWSELDALRKRWRDQLPLKDLRNQIAFHVDPEKIRAGLDRYIRKNRRLLLVGGDRHMAMYSSTALGSRLLSAGLRYTLRELRRASRQISADHSALGHLSEKVLIEVLEAKGLMKAF